MKHLKNLFLLITLANPTSFSIINAFEEGKIETSPKAFESETASLITEIQAGEMNTEQIMTAIEKGQLTASDVYTALEQTSDKNQWEETLNEAPEGFDTESTFGEITNFNDTVSELGFDAANVDTNPTQENLQSFKDKLTTILDSANSINQTIETIEIEIEKTESELGVQEEQKDTLDPTTTNEPSEDIGAPEEMTTEEQTIEQEQTSFIKKIASSIFSGIKNVYFKAMDALDRTLFGEEGANSDANIFAEVANFQSNYTKKTNNIKKQLADESISANQNLTDSLNQDLKEIEENIIIINSLVSENNQTLTTQQATEINNLINKQQDPITITNNTQAIADKTTQIIDNLPTNSTTIENSLLKTQYFKELNERAPAFDTFVTIDRNSDFNDSITQKMLDSEYEDLTAPLNTKISEMQKANTGATGEIADLNNQSIAEWQTELDTINTAYNILKNSESLAAEIELYDAATSDKVKNTQMATALANSRAARNAAANAGTLIKATQEDIGKVLVG